MRQKFILYLLSVTLVALAIASYIGDGFPPWM